MVAELFNKNATEKKEFLSFTVIGNWLTLYRFSLGYGTAVALWMIGSFFFDLETTILIFPLLWALLVGGITYYLQKRPNGFSDRMKRGIVYIALLALALWAGVYYHIKDGDVFSVVLFSSGYITVASLFVLHPFFLAGSFVVTLGLLFFLSGAESLYLPFFITLGLFGLFLSALRWGESLHRFKTEKSIRNNQEKAELALEGANLGYWNWDMLSNRIEVDRRWFSLIQRDAEPFVTLDRFFAIMHPEDRKRVAGSMQSYFEQKSDLFEETFRMETGSGEYRWLFSKGKINIRDEEGSPLAMHGIHQDVHHQVLQQSRLQESERRFRMYVEHSPVAVFVISGRSIIYANPQAADLTDYSIEELLSLPDLFILVPKDKRPNIKARFALYRATGVEDPSMVFPLQTRTGRMLWAEGRASLSGDSSGEILLSLVDITSRYEAEARIEQYATYDELTGVFNRRVGLIQLEKELYKAERGQYPLTVGFVDIDGLKMINDNKGHEAGDMLILSTTEAMKRVLRRGDTICRLGGDEFLLVHPNCDEKDAKRLWHRIEEEFMEEYQKHPDIPVKASSGYSSFIPRSGDSAAREVVDRLVHEADQRMYRVKRRRKDLGE
jgi:diguanylate cyclase (GGDEF)-like protein/PAS domain S-box-containing protein